MKASWISWSGLWVILVLGILFVCPVSAADNGALPVDADGDGIISSDEMAGAILEYLDEEYAGSGSVTGLYSDLTDGAYVYTYWDKTAKTVQDFSGQTITMTRPIHRAVVMNGESAETLRSLGFESAKVVGVG